MPDPFLYAIVDEDPDLMPEVAVEFSDGLVLLPEWVLDAIGYRYWDESRVQEFHKACARVRYTPFLARCRQEGSKLDVEEQREALNGVQRRFVAKAQEQIRQARQNFRRLARRPWQRLQ